MRFCSMPNVCCIYSNKDKNFKANHNYKSFWTLCFFVVSIVTKIRILKQITTKSFPLINVQLLYL